MELFLRCRILLSAEEFAWRRDCLELAARVPEVAGTWQENERKQACHRPYLPQEIGGRDGTGISPEAGEDGATRTEERDS